MAAVADPAAFWRDLWVETAEQWADIGDNPGPLVLTGDGAAIFATAAEEFNPKPDPYLHDPAGWVRDTTGEYMWSEQVRLVESVRDHRRTAVPASHGPGKSWSSARLVLWWLSVHPPGSAFVVTSAPTWSQVKAILWREIARGHTKGNLPGEILQTAEWKVDGELVAFGRKPADHDEHAFQGIHARYILVVLDEACGVPENLWTAAGTLMTNEDARLLAVGNPDDPLSQFSKVCEGADPTSGGISALGYNVIPISAFSTPNFTGEQVPAELRKDLTSRMWAEEFALTVGGPDLVEAHRALLALIDEGHKLDTGYLALPDHLRERVDQSQVYTAKVLGWFPGDTADGVVLWSWAQGCRQEHPNPATAPVELGIDVGGSDSGDETVIFERVGMRAGRRWSIRSADPEKVLAKALEAIDEAQPSAVKIDSIGIGWGLMGSIRAARRGLHVVGVNVSTAAASKTRFANLRAELWWEVARQLSIDRAWDLSVLDDQTLVELTAPRWGADRSGRTLIESKDDVRKRLGRSTDNADALILAFYAAGGPARGASTGGVRVPTGAALAGRSEGRVTR